MSPVAGEFSPEFEALCCCARTRMDEDAVGKAGAVFGSHIDWSRLLALAERHGVIPLLHLNLKRSFDDAAPPLFAARVSEIYERNVRYSIMLMRELVRLAGIFEAESIQAVSFKGFLLAETIYGDLTLRPAGDIDILIARGDIQAVMDLLAGEGYRELYRLSERQKRAYVGHYGSMNLFCSERGVALDIHWDMTRSFFPAPATPDKFNAGLQKIRLGSRSVLTPSSEDLLLILCIHGFKHRWCRLLWISDIAEIIRNVDDLDWDKVLRVATRTGMKRNLMTVLTLAVDLLGVRLPGIVLREIEKDRLVPGLAGEIRRELDRTGMDRSLGYSLRKALFHLRTMDRTVDRARYCLKWAVTPNVNDWMFISLPDALYPLYFIVRPFRMLIYYGRKLSGAGTLGK